MNEQKPAGASPVDLSLGLVERLRNTPNWLRESYGSWKDCTLQYDRAPFEAADEIERLRAALAEKDERIAAIIEGGRRREAELRSYIR